MRDKGTPWETGWNKRRFAIILIISIYRGYRLSLRAGQPGEIVILDERGDSCEP
jgi:hypothetical protein